MTTRTLISGIVCSPLHRPTEAKKPDRLSSSVFSEQRARKRPDGPAPSLVTGRSGLPRGTAQFIPNCPKRALQPPVSGLSNVGAPSGQEQEGWPGAAWHGSRPCQPLGGSNLCRPPGTHYLLSDQKLASWRLGIKAAAEPARRPNGIGHIAINAPSLTGLTDPCNAFPSTRLRVCRFGQHDRIRRR